MQRAIEEELYLYRQMSITIYLLKYNLSYANISQGLFMHGYWIYLKPKTYLGELHPILVIAKFSTRSLRQIYCNIHRSKLQPNLLGIHYDFCCSKKI